jgi:hypothetical protein
MPVRCVIGMVMCMTVVGTIRMNVVVLAMRSFTLNLHFFRAAAASDTHFISPFIPLQVP